MRTLPLLMEVAPASTGELWPSFAPPFRAMPLPPFASIELRVIVSLSVRLIWTPSSRLLCTELFGPIVFPKLIDSIAAPSFVFVTVLPTTLFWMLSTAMPFSCELTTTFPLIMLLRPGPLFWPPLRQAAPKVEMPWLETPKSGADDEFVPIVFDETMLLLAPQMSMPWYWDAIVLWETMSEPASMTSTPLLDESGNETV